MRNTITAIDALRESLSDDRKRNKRITLKEMIYNDEYENYEDSPGYESMPEFNHESHAMLNEPSGNEKSMSNKPIEGELPSEKTTDPEIMSILSNIRLAVINGLAKLAKKPDTIEYDTLKKLLQIVDRPIDAANKEKQ